MEAKTWQDTVQQTRWPLTFEEYLTDKQKQAEIAFKAGQESVKHGDVCAHCTKKVLQDGMKLVVKWIESNKEYLWGFPVINAQEWQAFLRENGLEESK